MRSISSFSSPRNGPLRLGVYPLCVLSALFLLSCGGGGGGGDGDGGRITVNITESSATVVLGESFQFHVTVTNTENKAVTWKVNDIPEGNNTVGRISMTGLYAAPVIMPNPNTVTVKAVSVQDMTCSDTAVLTISGPTPPDVQPRTVTVAAGGTQQFTADMAVDWSVQGASGTDPATWGTISDAGLYTAPLSPPWLGQVQVVGVSKDHPELGTPATVTIDFSNATLIGRYALRFRGLVGGIQTFAVGSLSLDGHGVVTSGTVDILHLGSAPVTATCTGTYAVGGDGRGTMTLTLQPAGGGGSSSFPVRFAMTSDTAARVIGFDTTGSGWGNLDPQDTASFGSGISGRYGFQLDGLVSGPPPYLALPIGIVGTFHGAGGTIDSGTETTNDNGLVSADLPFTGSYSSYDTTTGRGTATLDAGDGRALHFAYYLLMPGLFAFVSQDADVGYVGIGTWPDAGDFSDGSLAGPMVFFAQGHHGETVAPTVMAGVIAADAAGGLTNGVMDLDVGGSLATNVATTGTYTVAADGKTTAALTGGGWTFQLAGYALTGNFLLNLTAMSDYMLAGQFLPASPAMSTAIIHGSWSLTTHGAGATLGTAMSILMTLDGAGSLTGTADVNWGGTLSTNVAVSGTYTVETNGRGEATITVGASTFEYALYAASGRWMVFVPRAAISELAIGFASRRF